MSKERSSQNQQPSLRRDEQGLALAHGKMVVRADFMHLLPRLRPGNLNRELIVRAARGKRSDATLAPGQSRAHAPLVIDATAGLGEDSFLLAAAGFRVRLYERNPTIAALLRDALERAAATPELAAITTRMQLVEGDSIQALSQMATAHANLERPDIIVLDPMFPEKHNRAAAKKKLQLIQQLEDPCEDERALMQAALAIQPRKIIVKRPVKGPHLADMKPTYALTGKAIRFDCIVLPRS